MTESEDFAILAPVPLKHFESGMGVAKKEGFVAYGSDKWELFRQIDERRKGRKILVLIYPSHEDKPGKLTYRVSWIGWYTGHVESRNGAHPKGMKHRPPTTDSDTHWAVFWHVEGLRQLENAERLQIREIETVAGGWRKNAPPRGPEIVAVPPSLSDEDP